MMLVFVNKFTPSHDVTVVGLLVGFSSIIILFKTQSKVRCFNKLAFFCILRVISKNSALTAPLLSPSLSLLLKLKNKVVSLFCI